MEILNAKTVQDTWENLKGEILKAQTKRIPQRKKNKRLLTRLVWVHTEISDKLRKKKEKYKKLKKGLISRKEYQQIA